MFEVVGYESHKVYFEGFHSECSRFINSKISIKGKKYNNTPVYFGFDEALRIVEVAEVEKV